ncbi:MAG TPA: CotH kinase family protein [Verrucomicrobiota bacterium]|nr:hypothetical protein [Verrucomicrobiales bacterium]HRI16624.1 CotH kinase family protein [Verrucomicrobiota bacterium]
MRSLQVIVWSFCLVLIGACGRSASGSVADTPPMPARQPLPPADTDAFFAGPIRRFEITVPSKLVQKLRRQPREYVEATVVVGTNRFENVGLHLKGAAGSSRGWDDKPALTLNFDKFNKGQHCFGLDKLHLNNSVQDNSYLNELIASELYRRSGVPTARATHALVTLNGRDVGLYVLKEGYDSLFLKRNFPMGTNGPGNLYDGGFLRDLDQGLERDVGKGPDDQRDLEALVAAARASMRTRRDRLEAVLDVDGFLTFLVGQTLTDDWDGYGRNRNNYRIYFSAPEGKAVFIPHGMDQLFREPESGLNPGWSAMLAQQVMEVPEFSERYRLRLREVATNSFTRLVISNQLSRIIGRLQQVMTNEPAVDAQELQHFLGAQKRKIYRRVTFVERKLGVPNPSAGSGSESPPVMVPGEPWERFTKSGSSKLELVETKPGGKVLYVSALSRGTVASFRTTQFVSEGNYTFKGRALVRGVKGGNGARLRISGSQPPPGLTGDRDWTMLSFDFSADSEREVELVVELGADAGEAWFDLASLRVIRR